MLRVHQPLAVAKEQQPEDLPHHIGAVGVEEIHTPALPRRRKAAEHQQPRVGRQERLQRVAFYIGLVNHGC